MISNNVTSTNDALKTCICLNCNKPFTPYKNNNNNLYCSTDCFQKYRTLKSLINLTCPICNKIFQKNQKAVERQLKRKPDSKFYCSHDCNSKSQIGRTSPTKGIKRADYVSLQCKNCGKPFEVPKVKYNLNKDKDYDLYCSRECYDNHRVENSVTMIECDYCKKDFEIPVAYFKRSLKINPDHKFCCSKECQDNSLVTNEYRYYTDYEVPCAYCGKKVIRKGHQIENTKNGVHFCCRKHKGRYMLLLTPNGVMRSQLEQKLEQHIKTFYNIEAIFNDRTLCHGYEVDIYFPKYKLAIEINGPCHYEPIYGLETLAEIQKKDKIKQRICVKHGVKLVVIDEKLNYNKDNSLDIFEKYIKPNITI